MARPRIAWFLVNLLPVWLRAVAETHVKYKDPTQPVEVQVKDLLSRMTLEENIGQMTQIDRSVASFDVMKKYYIGSLLSGINSPRFNGTTAQDWIKMVNEFQKAALSTTLEIPMIYVIDAVHGTALSTI